MKTRASDSRLHNIFALAAVALLTHSPFALSADIMGQASVIDGDTLEIHGYRIRLHGIDAPESTQLCTKMADAGAVDNRLRSNSTGKLLNSQSHAGKRIQTALEVSWPGAGSMVLN